MEELWNLLLALPSIESLTRGQPRQDEKLPCVAIRQTGSQTALSYDDSVYLRKNGYELRIFERSMKRLDALADKIDEVLQPNGYRLTMAADVPEGTVKEKTLHYIQTKVPTTERKNL